MVVHSGVPEEQAMARWGRCARNPWRRYADRCFNTEAPLFSAEMQLMNDAIRKETRMAVSARRPDHSQVPFSCAFTWFGVHGGSTGGREPFITCFFMQKVSVSVLPCPWALEHETHPGLYIHASCRNCMPAAQHGYDKRCNNDSTGEGGRLKCSSPMPQAIRPQRRAAEGAPISRYCADSQSATADCTSSGDSCAVLPRKSRPSPTSASGQASAMFAGVPERPLPSCVQNG